MKPDRSHSHPPGAKVCHHRRLAEGPIAAVDVCVCGTMLVHLGFLTFRMEPESASELASTLQRAVTRHAAAGGTADPPEHGTPFSSGERGEA